MRLVRRSWLKLGHTSWTAALALAAGIVLASLLGGALPIPEVVVGESLDPGESVAARRHLADSAQAIETVRGDIDRILRSADIQQLIGPATVCDQAGAAGCAAQVQALATALAGWQTLLARQPAYEDALRSYDRALMAQTRALGGAGEPLREATWPLVGASAQIGLLRTKYGVFFVPSEIAAIRTKLEHCADPGDPPLPAVCQVAIAQALKIGQSIEARAAVGDDYRRALDRYQRTLDERVAIIQGEAGPRPLVRLIDIFSIAVVALGGALLAWQGLADLAGGRPPQSGPARPASRETSPVAGHA